MANTVTDFTPIKAKPHTSAEKQVGASDPNGRTDVINRPTLGLQAVVKRLLNSLVDGVTVSFADLTTTSAFDSTIQLVPRGYLAGLGLANNGSDTTNDIDIAVGVCADSTAAKTLTLASALTKRLDAAWAVGTNQGGLDTGAIADTTYHVWLIKRSDTGVVDALFSTSASAPTMPASYDYKRRIGSIVRTGGAIKQFTTIGDRVLWSSVVADVNATPNSAAVQTATLTVPLGIKVTALVRAAASNGTSATGHSVLLKSADESDQAAADSGLASLARITTTSEVHRGHFDLVTNTSAQANYRWSGADANNRLQLWTYGYVDRRGRDD